MQLPKKARIYSAAHHQLLVNPTLYAMPKLNMPLKKTLKTIALVMTLYGVTDAIDWNRNFFSTNLITDDMVVGTWLLDKALLKDQRLQKRFVSDFRRKVQPPKSLYPHTEFISEDFSQMDREIAENIVEEFTLGKTEIIEKMLSGKHRKFAIHLSRDKIEKMIVIRAANEKYLGFFVPVNANYILRYLPGSCGDRIEGFYRK